VIRVGLEIDLHLDVGDGDEYNKQTTLVRVGGKHIESDFNSKLGSGKGGKRATWMTKMLVMTITFQYIECHGMSSGH
jgi:hypothetical protein